MRDQLAVKAILARFKGDSWEAQQYCRRIREQATNPYLKTEYALLEIQIKLGWGRVTRQAVGLN